MRLVWGSGWVRKAMELGALTLLCWLVQVPGASAQEPLALVVRDEESGKTLWCAPVKTQEEFILEFLHSYELFLVRENYKILGPWRILFQGLVTRSMLNGQGFTAAQVHTRPDGWLEAKGEHTLREKIQFIMGSRQYADHRILLHGRKHHLSKFARPGMFLLVEIQPGECSGPNGER